MPLKSPREGNALKFHVYSRVSTEVTLGDPEAIIWASIRHLCSRYVAEGMAAHVHGVTGKRDREAVGRNLKLYIHQGSEFYDAGRNAKPNTAPLIYYYSFLNLAKALCELRLPRFHERSECYKHGISWRPDPHRLVDPGKDSVSITTRGVWHELWEAVMRARCPVANPTKLKIKTLFSFCPEVSFEFRQATNDWIRLMDLKQPEICADGTSMRAWLRFSLTRAELRGFRISVPSLQTYLQTATTEYVEVAAATREVRTFESTTRGVRRGQMAREAVENDIIALNVFAHLERNKNLQYFLPLQMRLPFKIPQLMVYYTLLFWFGSLVRYDPHSVAALMDSQWWMLMDGFMTQSRLWLLELFEWAFYQAETTLWLAR